MGVQIRIVPEVLNETADKYRMMSNQIDETQSELSKTIHNIDMAWEGITSQKMRDSLSEIMNVLENIQEYYDNNFDKLHGIVQVFEALDNDEPIMRIDKLDRVILGKAMPKPDLSFSWKEDRLRIIPDEIQVAAERCRSIANTYAELEDMTRDTLYDLEANWEGNAYDKFRAEADGIEGVLRGVQENLMEVADKMSRAATRYEEWDNSF